MRKSEMIDLIIEEFIKDKELIKQNLMIAADNIYLEKIDNNCRISILMKWETIERNELECKKKK